MSRRQAGCLVLGLFAFTTVSACATDDARTWSSPSGAVRFTLDRDADGLLYSLDFDGTDVVLPSRLGLTVGHDGIHPDDVVVGARDLGVHSETFPIVGPRTESSTEWREVEISLESDDRSAGTLRVRIFNNAAAWRYEFEAPGWVDAYEARNLREHTTWRLPPSLAWFTERPNAWKLKSYAGTMISSTADRLHDVSPTGPLQGKPLTLELGGAEDDPQGGPYAIITEAALFGFPGLRFEAREGRELVADLAPPLADAASVVDGGVVERRGHLATPWRVTLVADDLDGLSRSGSVIQSLCPKPEPSLFGPSAGEWIKPGRSVWHWWSGRLGTPDQERAMTDSAADLGFEYSLIDEGWEHWDEPWDTVRSITDHAREMGVGVWLWKHSDELRDPSDDFAVLRGFLDKVADAGAVGVKVDFFNAEDLAAVRLMERVVVESARRRLMVNFHGCTVPTGWERTYPNEMTREGVRGLELNGHAEGPLEPLHDSTAPLTRLVIGHGDYTPVGYSRPGPTDWAHQLAMAVLVVSPLQVYAEHPRVLLGAETKAARDVFEAIPSTWDESVVLPESSLGEVGAIARRDGERWFVGVVRGSENGATALRLGFLRDGRYEMVDLRSDCDVGDPDCGFVRTEREVMTGDSVDLPRGVGQGLTLMLTPIDG
ncbi:MAG: alpha-glucosidase [Phycisphaerae bacterium]|nr:alpha-glucosidase [Phycisphaerae bacterium]